MKNLIPVSAAGALALGAVGAHASIALPSTGSSDAVLFAEVISGYGAAGSSVVASYAGDTGLTVSQITSGLSGTTTVLGSDSKLAALFNADKSGDTVLFGILGATTSGNAYITPGVVNLLSTTTLNTAPSGRNTVLGGYLATYNNGITSLNSNLAGANSIEGSSPTTAGVWDYQTTTGLAYWGGGLSTASPTTTVATNLYDVTAGSGGSFANVSATLEATATLSASGLVLTNPNGGSTPPPVPLPASLWLLGSGLLGLAGISRRKVKA